jgi:hypothetical protein
VWFFLNFLMMLCSVVSLQDSRQQQQVTDSQYVVGFPIRATKMTKNWEK